MRKVSLLALLAVFAVSGSVVANEEAAAPAAPTEAHAAGDHEHKAGDMHDHKGHKKAGKKGAAKKEAKPVVKAEEGMAKDKN